MWYMQLNGPVPPLRVMEWIKDPRYHRKTVGRGYTNHTPITGHMVQAPYATNVSMSDSLQVYSRYNTNNNKELKWWNVFIMVVLMINFSTIVVVSTCLSYTKRINKKLRHLKTQPMAT